MNADNASTLQVYQAWPIRAGSVNSHGNVLLLQYTLVSLSTQLWDWKILMIANSCLWNMKRLGADNANPVYKQRATPCQTNLKCRIH